MNKDGYLDKEEVAKWIVPSEVNFSLEEAKHLIEVIYFILQNSISYSCVLDSEDT